jgi:hypothetical protein
MENRDFLRGNLDLVERRVDFVSGQFYGETDRDSKVDRYDLKGSFFVDPFLRCRFE